MPETITFTIPCPLRYKDRLWELLQAKIDRLTCELNEARHQADLWRNAAPQEHPKGASDA